MMEWALFKFQGALEECVFGVGLAFDWGWLLFGVAFVWGWVSIGVGC